MDVLAAFNLVCCNSNNCMLMTRLIPVKSIFSKLKPILLSIHEDKSYSCKKSIHGSHVMRKKS